MDIFNDAVDETLVFLLLMLLYYKVRFSYYVCLSRFDAILIRFCLVYGY
jgi:hypothetical protein